MRKTKKIAVIAACSAAALLMLTIVLLAVINEIRTNGGWISLSKTTGTTADESIFIPTDTQPTEVSDITSEYSSESSVSFSVPSVNNELTSPFSTTTENTNTTISTGISTTGKTTVTTGTKPAVSTTVRTAQTTAATHTTATRGENPSIGYIREDGHISSQDYNGRAPDTDFSAAAKVYACENVFGMIDTKGNALVWGNNEYGQGNVPADLPVVKKLGLGATFAAALDENGVIHVWGEQNSGQNKFGLNSPKFTDMDAAGEHIAAITSSGDLYIWGDNKFTGKMALPATLPKIVSVSCGTNVTAVIDITGGAHYFDSKGAYHKINLSVRAVSLAVLKNGVAVLGDDGKLYGDTVPAGGISKPATLPAASYIASGADTIGIISTEGKLIMWGSGATLTNGKNLLSVPVNLPVLTSAAVSGKGVICIGADGKLYIWGTFSSLYPSALKQANLGYHAMADLLY